VVLDEAAEYTVFTNDGRKFSAKVLARDPFQDLAILKIEQEKTKSDTVFYVQVAVLIVLVGLLVFSFGKSSSGGSSFTGKYSSRFLKEHNP